MGKQYKKSDLYKASYPNYLSWNKAIWITKVNDQIKDLETDELYIVNKIELTPVQGIPPRIFVEKLE